MKKFQDFTKQTFRGKSIYRILFNWLVYENRGKISGSVLDLASGRGASYNRYFPKGATVISGDLKVGGEEMIDFDKALPFPDNTFDAVLFFNAIYITSNTLFTLKEIYRVMKKGGTLFISSPFIANEMQEPHDYFRFTKEGLQRELERGGFREIKIDRFGERFSSAAYLLHSLLIFNSIRFIVNGLSIFLDKLIPKKILKIHPTPLGYFAICKK